MTIWWQWGCSQSYRRSQRYGTAPNESNIFSPISLSVAYTSGSSLRGKIFSPPVNSSGGIYRSRWGDAPIQTAALRLHASPGTVVHMEIDYLHMSTLNKIVGGQEVTFNAEGVSNTHFRRLAEESANMTSVNSTNATNHPNTTQVSGDSPPSSSPPSSNLPPSSTSPSSTSGCSDVPNAFATIEVCTAGSACYNGLVVGGALFGGVSGACQTSMAIYAAAAMATGCILPFTTTVADREDSLLELCARGL
eukprot:4315796-Prymnesium_polylepis.1